MNTSEIELALDNLRLAHSENWDADDAMPSEYVMLSPLGRFVVSVNEADHEILAWLTFFAARRALPCWEQYVRDQTPRNSLKAIEKLLRDNIAPNWDNITSTIFSPFNDCLYSATQSAADAIVNCAKYLQTGDPIYATYCLSSADVACDHVSEQTRFRNWLIDVAIPAAFAKRDLLPAEQEAYREFATS